MNETPISGMPTQSILNDFWRDALSILGVIGFVLTAAGVWLAYVQMRRTATAAEAATDAAIESLRESEARYNKSTFAQCARLLADARELVRIERWDRAATRLGDLAELLLQLAETSDQWSGYVKRLYFLENALGRVFTEVTTFSTGTRGKWEKLDTELRTLFAERLKPFDKTETDS